MIEPITVATLVVTAFGVAYKIGRGDRPLFGNDDSNPAATRSNPTATFSINGNRYSHKNATHAKVTYGRFGRVKVVESESLGGDFEFTSIRGKARIPVLSDDADSKRSPSLGPEILRRTKKGYGVDILGEERVVKPMKMGREELCGIKNGYDKYIWDGAKLETVEKPMKIGREERFIPKERLFRDRAPRMSKGDCW